MGRAASFSIEETEKLGAAATESARRAVSVVDDSIDLDTVAPEVRARIEWILPTGDVASRNAVPIDGDVRMHACDPPTEMSGDVEDIEKVD